MLDKKPNARLLAALEEAEKIEKGIIKAKVYSSVEELDKELGAELEAELHETVKNKTSQN
jgi:catalase